MEISLKCALRLFNVNNTNLIDVKCTQESNLLVNYSNVRGNCELLCASFFCICLTFLDCTRNMVHFLRKARIIPLQKPFLDFILSKHGCSVES
jgi:hypothetical protein